MLPNTRVDTNTRITNPCSILYRCFLFSFPHTRVIRDDLIRVPRQHPGHPCASTSRQEVGRTTNETICVLSIDDFCKVCSGPLLCVARYL